MFKRGVSLVTVLLFMTMATIAATAVLKWLFSEERTSAARLRQSEAYQASQAGINAARAWMSYNGNETGALVTQFQNNQTPILLNQQLQFMVPSNNGQRFDVLLAGVDAREQGKPKIKLISTGYGRDNSKYSQVAILNVEGLYQEKVPSVGKRANYQYAYFGGSTTFSGDHKATSMLINGNWSGNPGEVTNDFIVTGNVKLSGSDVKVGGTTCTGGKLEVENIGLNSKNVYAVDHAKFNGEIDGNAFFEKGLKITTSGPDTFTVGKNMTLYGVLEPEVTRNTRIMGNLCVAPERMEGENKPWTESEANKGIIRFKTDQNRTFIVNGSVWIQGNAIENSQDDTKYQHILLGEKNTSELYVTNLVTCSSYGWYHIKKGWGEKGNLDVYTSKAYNEMKPCPTGAPIMLQAPNAAKTYSGWENKWNYYEWYYYEKNAAGGGYQLFTSNSKKENLHSDASGQPKEKGIECAKDVKDYCNEIWRPVSDHNDGCDGAKYKVDDILSTAYDKFIEYGNKSQCLKDIVGMDNNKKINFNVAQLNRCYSEVASSSAANTELYNGYMVVKLDNNSLFNNPSGTLEGKYIFVFTNEIYQTKVPPTTTDSYVMLYLKEGAKGELLQAGSGRYNYFIYTEKDIMQIQGAKWNGSFYAQASTCAKVGNMNSNAELIYDEAVVNSMTDAGIICDYGTSCTASGSTDGGSDDPGSTAPAEDNMTSGGYDVQWVSYAPSLKITLATEYANNEVSDNVASATMDQSLMVSPRVIYLTNKDKLRDNYSVLYYGGLTRAPSGGMASCFPGAKLNVGSSVTEDELFESVGLYSCNYSEGNDDANQGIKRNSPFWVWVNDERSTSRLRFDNMMNKLCEDKTDESQTVEVYLNNTNGIEGEVQLFVYNQSKGVTLVQSSALSNGSDVNGGTLYTLRTPSTSERFPVFTMNISSCRDASGFVQMQLQDKNLKDELGIGSPSTTMYEFGVSYGKITRGELSESSVAADEIKNRPDCFEVADHATVSWAAYTTGTGGEQACTEMQGASSSTGPWQCQTNGSVVMRPYSTPDWTEACELVTDGVTVYPDVSTDYTVYASLKKKQYKLNVNINGMKGSADTYYGDISFDEETEVEVVGQDNVLLGTCKTGNRGDCEFTLTHGKTYYVKAKGSNFSEWQHSCSTSPCLSGITKKANTFVINAKDDVSVEANFYKAGACFNENFTNLYSYCDHEVTPNVLKGYYKKNENFDDWGYGDNAVDGSSGKHYCIDQCVTDVDHRSSGNYGRAPWHYDIYCSVKGTAGVYSYYDPSGSSVGGGYYPQDDPYAVWLKVAMRHGFGQTRNPTPTVVKKSGNDYGGWWNTKPNVNRAEGYLNQDIPHRSMYLRKMEAGYNGTLTKTFSMRNTAEKSTGDGGNFPAVIFRSNADMSAYYQLAVDPGAEATATPHFYLCYCTEYSCFNEKTGDGHTAYNSGHCVTEPIKGNMVFATFESDNTFEVSVDLEEDEAHVVLAYHDARSYSGKTTYSEYTFDLRDSRLLQNADELASIREDQNVYVGFAVNKDNELLRNINWRSGGSCKDAAQMTPSVYCGFEQGIAGINTAVEPTRFVYDYCPEGGSCKCTYKYSLDGGSSWRVPPLSFSVSAKRYEFGDLQIKAECYEEHGKVEPVTIENACDGFVTFNPLDKGEMCTESYSIYTDGYVTSASRDYIDPVNGSQWISYGDTIYAMDENLWGSKPAYNEFTGISRQRGPLDPGIRYEPTDGSKLGKSKPLIGFGCNYTGASGVCTNEGYLQLTDKISSEKNFLNLNGSILSFDYILNWYTEKFIYWVEDVDGHASARVNVSETSNTWGYKDFAKKTNPKTNSWLLVWNRDARGEPIYSNASININTICGTNNDCDPTKVSRLYFRLENNNRYGVHIMNLQTSCPNALSLKNCKLNDRETSTENPLVVYSTDASRLKFTANLSGANNCEFTGSYDGRPACAGTVGDFTFNNMDLRSLDGPGTVTFKASNANDDVLSCDVHVDVKKTSIGRCIISNNNGSDKITPGSTITFSTTVQNQPPGSCTVAINDQSTASCTSGEYKGYKTISATLTVVGRGSFTPYVTLGNSKLECSESITVDYDDENPSEFEPPQEGNVCLGSENGWPQIRDIATGAYTVSHDCQGKNPYSFFYVCGSTDDLIYYGGKRLDCGTSGGQEIQKSTDEMPANGSSLEVRSGKLSKFGCEIAGGSPTCSSTGVTITSANSNASTASSSSRSTDDCEEVDAVIGQYDPVKDISGSFNNGCYSINTEKACSDVRIQYNDNVGYGEFTINGKTFECRQYIDSPIPASSTLLLDVPSGCRISKMQVYNCDYPASSSSSEAASSSSQKLMVTCDLNNSTGYYTAAITNAENVEYDYAFTVADPNGNVIVGSEETGKSNAPSFTNTVLIDGKGLFRYILELTYNGEKVNCAKEVNLEGISADCSFGGASVTPGASATFSVSNVTKQNADALTMVLSREGVAGQNVNVSKVSGASVNITAPSVVGQYTYTLKYEGNTVCNANLNVVAPITAECPALETYPSQPIYNVDFKVSGMTGDNLKMVVKNTSNNPATEIGTNNNCSQNNEYECKNTTIDIIPSEKKIIDYKLFINGERKCGNKITVKDVLNCKVDKTTINLEDHFTLTPNYAGSCYKATLTQDGAQLYNNCQTKYTITPPSAGTHKYSFDVTNGSVGTGSCGEFTVTVNSNPPTITCPDNMSDKPVGESVSFTPTVGNCESGCTYSIFGGSTDKSNESYSNGQSMRLEAVSVAGNVPYTVTVKNADNKTANCSFTVTYSSSSSSSSTPSSSSAGGDSEVNVSFTYGGSAYDFVPGKTYKITSCSDDKNSLICAADGPGKDLYVNGSNVFSSLSWQSITQYQYTGKHCYAGAVITVTGGTMRCQNNW